MQTGEAVEQFLRARQLAVELEPTLKVCVRRYRIADIRVELSTLLQEEGELLTPEIEQQNLVYTVDYLPRRHRLRHLEADERSQFLNDLGEEMPEVRLVELVLDDRGEQTECVVVLSPPLVLFGEQEGAIHEILAIEMRTKIEPVALAETVVQIKGFVLVLVQQVVEHEPGLKLVVVRATAKEVPIVEADFRTEDHHPPVVLFAPNRVYQRLVRANEALHRLDSISGLVIDIRVKLFRTPSKRTFDLF